MHKHRRRHPNHKRQIPALPKPLPNHRSLRKNRFHHPALHSMEKTHHQTNVQGQRRLFRLQVSFRQTPTSRWTASLFCCFGRGNCKFPPKDALRYESVLTKAQRDEWFSQIWAFKGTHQTASELERRTAAYPEEIAERLIRMFSVKGELVLDPFLGSGTTTKMAMQNQRNSIGYESDQNLLPVITRKIGKGNRAANVTIVKR